MLFDVENQFDSQVFTGGTSEILSTDVIDIRGGTNSDISIGRPFSLVINPKDLTNVTGTLTIKVLTSDATNLGTADTLVQLTAVAGTSLKVNQLLELPIPQGVIKKKYLGYSVTLSAGTMNITLRAFLVPSDEIPVFKPFPKIQATI